MARVDLTVRGGGIFGLACAFTALRRGAKVRLIRRLEQHIRRTAHPQPCQIGQRTVGRQNAARGVAGEGLGKLDHTPVSSARSATGQAPPLRCSQPRDVKTHTHFPQTKDNDYAA